MYTQAGTRSIRPVPAVGASLLGIVGGCCEPGHSELLVCRIRVGGSTVSHALSALPPLRSSTEIAWQVIHNSHTMGRTKVHAPHDNTIALRLLSR